MGTNFWITINNIIINIPLTDEQFAKLKEAIGVGNYAIIRCPTMHEDQDATYFTGVSKKDVDSINKSI